MGISMSSVQPIAVVETASEVLLHAIVLLEKNIRGRKFVGRKFLAGECSWQGAIAADAMRIRLIASSAGVRPNRQPFRLLDARGPAGLYVHQNLAGRDFGNSKIEVG